MPLPGWVDTGHHRSRRTARTAAGRQGAIPGRVDGVDGCRGTYGWASGVARRMDAGLALSTPLVPGLTLSVAHPAYTPAPLAQVVGTWLIGVTVPAGGSNRTSGTSSTVSAPSSVLNSGHRLHVRWVDAPPHIAQMVDNQTLGDGANEQFVGDSVSPPIHRLARHPALVLAVAIAVSTSQPRPALVVAPTVRLCPEAVGVDERNRLRHGSTSLSGVVQARGCDSTARATTYYLVKNHIRGENGDAPRPKPGSVHSRLDSHSVAARLAGRDRGNHRSERPLLHGSGPAPRGEPAPTRSDHISGVRPWR